jgi:diguanylate cyclase (GGDEF)-like protein
MVKIDFSRYAFLPAVVAITAVAVAASVSVALLVHSVLGTTMERTGWLITISAPLAITPVLASLLLHLLARLHQANERLRHVTETDHLTRAYNRRYFLESLREEIARTQRHGNPMVVAFIDVDDFKGINDCHGHLGGDAVLRALADVCLAELRATDTFARIGGEEFAVLMPETTADGALHLLERLRSRVEAMRVELPGALVKVTVSVGVAENLEHDVNHVLTSADRCLYAAKHQGKNRVVFDPGMA